MSHKRKEGIIVVGSEKPWLANAGQGISCFELLVITPQWSKNRPLW